MKPRCLTAKLRDHVAPHSHFLLQSMYRCIVLCFRPIPSVFPRLAGRFCAYTTIGRLVNYPPTSDGFLGLDLLPSSLKSCHGDVLTPYAITTSSQAPINSLFITWIVRHPECGAQCSPESAHNPMVLACLPSSCMLTSNSAFDVM